MYIVFNDIFAVYKLFYFYLKGCKVYGVQSGHDSGCTKFFSKITEMTDGRHVNLSNFSSIFDFLMMICYREGNPDMLPVSLQLATLGNSGHICVA